MQKTSFPKSIAVIGGGRWARVLLSTTCSIAPPETRITVHTAYNQQAMKDWAADNNLTERIEIFSDYPKFDSASQAAMVVVNAARDHEKAVRWGLSAGVPVLVEKPVTLSYWATRSLMELASNNKTKLASAHIFLFSRHLSNFKTQLQDLQKPSFLKITWEDPKVENRYGEQKKYDSGLPIYTDLIPHILSITTTLFPGEKVIFKGLNFLRGGAQLELNCALGDMSFEISLARDGEKRKRFVEVRGENGVFTLDFAIEPGVISKLNTTFIGDPEATSGLRPSEEMLLAYFHWASGGDFDPRLDIEVGLRANQIIDEIFLDYRSALSVWLIDNINASRGKFGYEIRYALSELFQREKTLSNVELAERIVEVEERFLDKDFLTQLLEKNIGA